MAQRTRSQAFADLTEFFERHDHDDRQHMGITWHETPAGLTFSVWCAGCEDAICRVLRDGDKTGTWPRWLVATGQWNSTEMPAH